MITITRPLKPYMVMQPSFATDAVQPNPATDGFALFTDTPFNPQAVAGGVFMSDTAETTSP